MARVKVLICDDAVLYASMMSAWFSDDPDIEIVATTATAAEGLELIERLGPDVVLLDHNLPDGSSETVVPRIRAAAPDVAVVPISALPADRLAQTATEAGADAWVPKAATLEDVRGGILQAAATRS